MSDTQLKTHSKIEPFTKEDLISGKVTNLPLTENALRVFARKYLVKNDEGKYIETPEDVYRRVAKTLAEVERDYGKSDSEIQKIEEDFYSVMTRFEFTPAGRTLQNAGSTTATVANCIVLSFEDSMEGIFSTLKEAAQLQQLGSGLGFPWHLLRPAGYTAKRTMGKASGPVSFLRVYDIAFGTIKQQKRHGANMGIMNVDHPDILEFIRSKNQEGDIRNFNISVGLTDQFMQAVKDNSQEPWMCEWKGKKLYPREIIRDEYDTVVEVKDIKITPKELFNKLVQAAWTNGEPGCIFPDTVNKTNPLPGLGRIEACNPCGEQMLHAGDVCNLGSIILDNFVENGDIKWNRLSEVTRTAVRLMDNVVDIFEFGVEKVQKMSQANRRLGLGVMGFADMLYKLGIPYNSEHGYQTARDVMGFITNEGHKMSQELAEEKGVFPNYGLSVFSAKGVKMRNAALTTVAPTGSISMLPEVSSGIEPFFSLAYHKKMLAGGSREDLFYVNKHLLKMLRDKGIYSDELVKKIVDNGGSVQGLSEIPEDIQKVYVTAMDMSAEAHIKMQGAFQEKTDNSISKTINFKTEATVEDMSNGLMLAWELGCKGCTVYRDGSRELQILSTEKTKEGKVKSKEVIEKFLMEQQEFIKRPIKASGVTYKQATPLGSCYITINSDENDEPFEVFITIGKAGSDLSAFAESLGRMISMNLRMPSGMSSKKRIRKIADELIRIGGSNSIGFGRNRISSLPDAVAKVMLDYVGALEPVEETEEGNNGENAKDLLLTLDAGQTGTQQLGLMADFCPSCGQATLVKEEGCYKCYSCAYSKC